MTYQEAARHVCQLFSTATPEQLQMQIHWTPRWTARDVLAHLVNNAQLALAGVRHPPSDEAAHQAVMAVRELPIEVLIGSLEQLAHRVKINLPESVEETRPTEEWDLVCHLADVSEVWELPQLPDAFWRPVLHQALDYCLAGQRFECQLAAGDSAWGSGPRVVVHDHYQLFRAIFARRPLSTLDADGDPQLLASAVFFS